MTNKEKIELKISKTLEYSRSKPIDSTLTERWFLLDEATRACEGLPQPLAFGKGMAYILERAATPIEEYDILVENGYGWVTNLDGTRSEVVFDENKLYCIYEDDGPVVNPEEPEIPEEPEQTPE